MDKNTWIGFLLIAAIIVGFNIINRPSEEEIAERQRIQDSIAVAQKMEAEAQAISQQIAQQIDAEVPEETIEDLNQRIEAVYGPFALSREQQNTPSPFYLGRLCQTRRTQGIQGLWRYHQPT